MVGRDMIWTAWPALSALPRQGDPGVVSVLQVCVAELPMKHGVERNPEKTL